MSFFKNILKRFESKDDEVEQELTLLTSQVKDWFEKHTLKEIEKITIAREILRRDG